MHEIIHHHDTPYLLMGDLNTLSPRDKYSEEELIREFQRFRNNGYINIKADVKSLMRCRLVRVLEESGLQDTLSQWRSTVPTTARYSRKIRGMRVDYIFVSSDIKILSSYVFKNKDAEIASDHYPVVATIRF